MVFKVSVFRWNRISALTRKRSRHLWVKVCALLLLSSSAHAASPQAKEFLESAQKFYKSGQYFKAARYGFAASSEGATGDGYSWAALGLIQARLYHSAAYFFIRTLQSGDKDAIRRVLTRTEEMVQRVGPDLLRGFLLKHTTEDFYDDKNRSAFHYLVGKSALLAGKEETAIAHLGQVSSRSSLWPFALQMRGTAYAIAGQNTLALNDFETCADRAGDSVTSLESPSGKVDPKWARLKKRQVEDLRVRCLAGRARTFYQMNKFDESDQAYDQIPKKSFVWTDILFEQAWNAFAKGEFNRTLGKLVSYESPELNFQFNTEIDVLRAQSYLALCLYDDANKVIEQFKKRYTAVGEEVKEFVERHSQNLLSFFDRGKQALNSPLHRASPFNRMLNLFVRSPYFVELVAAEKDVEDELIAIRQFNLLQPGVSKTENEGFPGFLREVLSWRRHSVRWFGGAFVKNSLLDRHLVLIHDFEKIAFIKLEMLRRAKESLMGKKSDIDMPEDAQEASRRDYQYYWTFNGEFWNDEIGDYVFGLKSQCGS